MKLVTFRTAETKPRVGLAVSSGIVDLQLHLPKAPPGMIELMTDWKEWRKKIEFLATNQRADLALESIELLAPVPRPGKILGIGLNYADHVHESGMERPAQQLWFAKASSATQVPFGIVELPLASTMLDYEAELAFVIGRRCRHVSREKAADVIFGYCAANDFSVRDWQLRTSQFTVGKSFDTHAPFGPWIVTPDEVDDPHDLRIECFVNGERRQSSSTSQLIFDCYQQVEHLSTAMTLEPGDVILTGTPGGAGAGFKPPRYLEIGDEVEVSIERIGSIRHTVAPER
jgi:2-keto-4-pentenoate hydratase/2-oxohepta-3-ene-1,7-dioic acid hydratase in catechol pathway